MDVSYSFKATMGGPLRGFDTHLLSIDRVTIDIRVLKVYTFNTLISMVTLIIDSCCDFVKTSDLTPVVALTA